MQKISLSKETIKYIKEENKRCIDCKKCYKACPMMDKYGESPKAIMEGITTDKKIDKAMAYSCMLCGLCKKVCPKDIDLGDVFYKSRKDIFSAGENNLKDLGYKSVKFHQQNSFSSVFSYSSIKKDHKTVFMPGCSLASYSDKIVVDTFKYLKNQIEDISIIYECCAKPTMIMGDTEKFKKYYSKLEEVLSSNDIDEVIVACPNCYKVVKENSPDVKVRYIWSIINESGLPIELEGYYANLEQRFTLHDPCPTRYNCDVHDDVREILNSLGLKIDEFKNNRENTECCGSGGMTRVTSNEISIEQTKKRAEETENDTVISYCESCCESMMLAGKSTLHVLDFMFNEDVKNKKIFSQENSSTVGKWMTRRKGIKKIKKL